MALIEISWEQYLLLTNQILAKLSQENYKPDVVVGIARGGLIPMVTISNHYKTRQVGVIFMRKTASDDKFASMLPEAECLGYGMSCLIEGQSVLLADNIIQTGQTIKKASELLYSLGVKAIRIVSICRHKSASSFDYYAPMDVEADDWVVFPWDSSSM